MGWPKLVVNIEAIANSLSAQVNDVGIQVAAWRGSINANSAADGVQSEACYQALVSLRNYGNVQVSNNAVGLAAAYQRRNSSLSGFEPNTEWAPLKNAIDSFVVWFKANWPKNTAGNPTFVTYSSADDLVSLSVPLSGAGKAAVLAQIDAVLAAIT